MLASELVTPVRLSSVALLSRPGARRVGAMALRAQSTAATVRRSPSAQASGLCGVPVATFGVRGAVSSGSLDKCAGGCMWSRGFAVVSGPEAARAAQRAAAAAGMTVPAGSTKKKKKRFIIKLGIDPRKPDQGVRGVVQLPHGTGKEVVVAVFAEGAAAEEARAAGAQVVGGEDLVEEILEGRLDFTKAIASPDMMRYIGRAARILGPRGLMPNPKLGTVTPAVGDAVRAALRGQCEFRAEKRGIVHAGFGRVSFSEDALAENLRSFMVAVSNLKPEGAKGQYLRHATISSTMGKGYSIDMAFLDPSSRWFMRRPLTGQEGED